MELFLAGELKKICNLEATVLPRGSQYKITESSSAEFLDVLPVDHMSLRSTRVDVKE